MPHFPTVTTEIEGYAHCTNHRGACPGYEQQPVRALRDEVSHVFPGMPGNAVENTHIHLRFADDDADAPCPHCRARRELSETARPTYQEFIPGEVLAAVPSPDPVPAAGVSKADFDALRAELAELRAEKAAA